MSKRYLTLGECIKALDILMPVERKPEDITNCSNSLVAVCVNLNKSNSTCKTGCVNVESNESCPFVNSFNLCLCYEAENDAYDLSNKDNTYKDHALEIRKEDEDIAKEVLPMPFILSIDNDDYITADPVKVVPILAKIIQCLIYYGHYHHGGCVGCHYFNCYQKGNYRRSAFHAETCKCD